MATIQKFEDLICWQKGRGLAKEVYRSFRACKDYGFKDQIQRAAVSIVSNIAEGFERGTKAEFVNYLYIAKGSAGEVRAQLYIALDVGYLNIETFKSLNSLAIECSRLIQSFADKVKGNIRSGLQHKHVPPPDPIRDLIEKHVPHKYRQFSEIRIPQRSSNVGQVITNLPVNEGFNNRRSKKGLLNEPGDGGCRRRLGGGCDLHLR